MTIQLRLLHKKMFGDVWIWAGEYRTTEKNIGITPYQIHPFPNGNGRLSRLMADLLLEELEGSKLYWGDANLVNVSEIRSKYIESLRKADAGDYKDLLDFTKAK
jgi:fido (protein-threonine AMPylation protein)